MTPEHEAATPDEGKAAPAATSTRKSRVAGTTAISVRLPDALHARLLKTAETRDVGTSHLATKALTRLLDELDKQEPI